MDQMELPARVEGWGGGRGGEDWRQERELNLWNGLRCNWQNYDYNCICRSRANENESLITFGSTQSSTHLYRFYRYYSYRQMYQLTHLEMHRYSIIWYDRLAGRRTSGQFDKLGASVYDTMCLVFWRQFFISDESENSCYKAQQFIACGACEVCVCVCSRAGHFRYFWIFSIIKTIFFICYQVHNLFLHQSYLKSPLTVKLTW